MKTPLPPNVRETLIESFGAALADLWRQKYETGNDEEAGPGGTAADPRNAAVEAAKYDCSTAAEITNSSASHRDGLRNYLAATERWNEVKAVYDETEERLDEARAAKAAAFDELVRAWRLELVERFGIDLAKRLSPGPEEIF